jgi:uncharacterized damage-inducible protein DinB
MMNADQAKAAADLLTAIWEGEFPATCRVLAAVGGGDRDYRPDGKSRTAWEIAVHLATADVWFADSIAKGGFAWDPDAAANAVKQFQSADDLERFYRAAFPERLAALRALDGATLAGDMSFFGMFQWPRARFIGFANNHSVHHRGQLAAYLRAMGSKVPDIYGPSADAEKVEGTA